MDRVVLVSGGTGGLGSFIVEKFLQNGDIVLVTDLQEIKPTFAERFAQWQNKLHTFQVDVTDAAALAKLASIVNEKFQGIQILVNVVGGFAMGKIADISEVDLDKMLDINLKSSFLCSKAFLNQIEHHEDGRIINISARAALQGSAMMGAYSISKAAVISFTQSLADELKEGTTTVNAVLPSIIDTLANRHDMPAADFSKWVQPQDLANVIFFLASVEARAVNGASIPVYYKS